MPKTNLSDTDKAVIITKLLEEQEPKHIAESMEHVSYPQVLRLRRQLEEAQKTNTVHELMNLDDAAMEMLKSSVQSQQATLAAPLAGELISKTEEVIDNVKLMKSAEAASAKTAEVIFKQIELRAAVTTSSDTLLVLAEASSKLHTALFGKSGIQINTQVNAGGGFESMLTD